MLTTITTLKSRLALLATDTTYDALLTSAIKALSARFDKETNRTLARTENATLEFDPSDTELCPPIYPIESVSKFESKSSESAGWQEITPTPGYLIRSGCIISLPSPIYFIIHNSSFRLTYCGGFVLPGTTPQPSQTPLPDDIEQACIEQVAFWYTNRDHLGLKTYWPSGVAYSQFATFDLLDSVRATLAHHRRWSL